MRYYLIALCCLLTIGACTKEQPDDNDKPQVDQMSEIESLRKEIEELKAQVEAMTPSDSESSVSMEEFEALKSSNERLKEQVDLLTSGFFEVDGLYFDLNGTLVSTEKIESQVVEDKSTNGSVKLTTTRTYDAQGRVIEIMRKYSGYNSMSSIPYYWRQELFEYSGKTSKTTTRTFKYGLPAGTPYEEVITEKSYW
jgi:cell division protein FtsB